MTKYPSGFNDTTDLDISLSACELRDLRSIVSHMPETIMALLDLYEASRSPFPANPPPSSQTTSSATRHLRKGRSLQRKNKI
jgi:hypothetical protein